GRGARRARCARLPAPGRLTPAAGVSGPAAAGSYLQRSRQRGCRTPFSRQGHPGGCMSTTAETAHTAQAKDEFFAAGMYMVHVTAFPHQPGVASQPAGPRRGARLDVWRTDPADAQHIPGPGAGGVLLSTPAFSLENSGNRTLTAPKRSWKVALEGAAHGGAHLAGMARVNLKSMYNDPS